MYTLVAVLMLLSLAGTLSYVYQDRIIALFIDAANEKVRTPIQVEKINFSLLEKFPHITVSLYNVNIQEGIEGSEASLGKAKSIAFAFNVFGFFRGDYVIDQVYLEEAEVFLKVLPSGEVNYSIFEKDTAAANKSLSFKLERIRLDNVLFTYEDMKRDQEYVLFANKATAKLASQDNIYDIAVEGDMESRQIRVNEDRYFRDKNLRVKALLNYHLGNDSLNIQPSTIFVHDSEFAVQGVYHGADQHYIQLDTEGKDTDIQTILSLMPENIYNKFKVYRSEGNVYFNAHLEGRITDTSSPKLRIAFGCQRTSFYHPDIKRKIQDVTLEGTFEAEKANDLSTAALNLRNVTGTFEKRPFKGNLYIQNFEDYFVRLDIDAEIDAGSLLEFYPIESIRKASGLVDLDISFESRLNNLRKKGGVTKAKTSGEIILKDLSFDLANTKLPFTNFRGSFIFKNEDLAISDFSGKVGSSDFMVNGFFKNIIAYVIFEEQPISIEADLQSQLLDIDELLTGNVSESPSETVEGQQYYSFKISPKLALSFNCNVDQVKFRRFFGHNIKGKLQVKDQVAKASNVKVDAAGGNMVLTSTVDARKENFIAVDTEASFDKIHIDSLFYVFHNFNQDFLMDKHLKGQIFAEVNTYMAFDENLRFRSDLFKADVGIAIRNGELNNFEPMQELSKFVEEESLSKLRFSELRNIIRIQDETIHLPAMEVKSNVSTIEIKGTHTFDQHIDYYLKVPLRNFRKQDRDEAFGAIEDDGKGAANLFLTIRGTTEDYKIAYDSKAVVEKIKGDIKKEGQELKEVFQNKGVRETQDVELNEEEYFDFD